MHQDYDVFEVFPDHTLRWRVCVHGTQLALATLEEIAKRTVNECFASNVGTQEIIGRANEGPSTAHVPDDDGSGAN